MRPVPASSVSVPLADILNTAFDAVKYTLPLPSTVTRCGCVMAALSAATGVDGTDPPAMVETRYCGWAAAKDAKTKASPSELLNREYKTLSRFTHMPFGAAAHSSECALSIMTRDSSILVHPRGSAPRYPSFASFYEHLRCPRRGADGGLLGATRCIFRATVGSPGTSGLLSPPSLSGFRFKQNPDWQGGDLVWWHFHIDSGRFTPASLLN